MADPAALLAAERASASFPPDALAALISGNPARRRRMVALAQADPLLADRCARASSQPARANNGQRSPLRHRRHHHCHRQHQHRRTPHTPHRHLLHRAAVSLLLNDTRACTGPTRSSQPAARPASR